jgi:molybdopterin molybdotransferase
VISLEAARQTVLAGCVRLPATDTALDDALGCVLAETITSDQSVPPFANTAMDGYAVRAADTARAPATLQVIGTLAAGAAPTQEVGPGQAIRIMTGAPIPPGADAIVMVELTHTDGDSVVIEQAANPGDHFRPAGEDLQPGQEVFTAGTVLGPGHLGVLASLGRQTVSVYRRPRVGVLSTGDELVDGPQPLEPGQIRDSNRHTLVALLRKLGIEAVDLGLARDTEEDITAAFQGGLADCDAIVTSGGVSMGDFDYVKKVLDQLSGGTFQWMQVAIRPAKPLAFGTVKGKPVFGLPGNPVSSMVSFELFAGPGLRQMMGRTELHPPQVQAITDDGLSRRPDGKTVFARVVCTYRDGAYHVRSAGGQASNLLYAMAVANALAVVPDGDGIEPGGHVTVMLL